MTWTYSGDPANSDLDEVRYRAGLIKEDEPYASNEEINFCLAEESNNIAAAALACENVAAMLAREVDLRAGPGGELSLKMSQASDAFYARAKALRKMATGYAAPWSAAISIDEKDEQLDDDDRVLPKFTLDMFDADDDNEEITSDWNKYGEKD